MLHALRKLSALVSLLAFAGPLAAQTAPAWQTSFYNGRNAQLTSVATDALGNVFSAGHNKNASGKLDYLLIKYSPAGVQQWVRTYDGGLWDWASDVKADALGNVYVTGVSVRTPSVTAYPFDLVTIKYDASGVQQWLARSSAGSSAAISPGYRGPKIAIDQGDVFVTGEKLSPFAYSDIVTATYTTPVTYNSTLGINEPTTAWTTISDWSAGFSTGVVGIRVTPDGHVVIGGTSRNAQGAEEFIAMKLNRSTGLTEWSKTYLPAGASYSRALAMHADAFGVYLTGVYGLTTGHDALTVKLSTGGVFVWQQSYDHDGDWDSGQAVKTDAVGNVYVSGDSWNTTLNSYKYITTKYPIGADLPWSSSFDGDPAGGWNNVFPRMEVDRSGNVYVLAAWYDATWTGGYQEQYDIKLVKYNGSTGAALWSDVQGGVANEWDWAEALALDPWDNVVVIGTMVTDPVLYFYVARTFKYGNSQAGPDVEVSPDADSTLTFDSVTTAGETQVEYSLSAPALPAGFELGGPAAGGTPTYIDIITTATFDATGGQGVHLSFVYDPALFTSESEIKLLHYVGGEWVDVTTSLDTVNNIVHGFTPSFSFFAIVQAPLTVIIDIKPGSSPNTINLGSNGVVPVAILSSASFDARDIDPLTVALASATAKLKGKGTPLVTIRDVNNDGRMDLVVQILTDGLQLSSTATAAILIGKTKDGKTWIRGSDSVRIVPE